MNPTLISHICFVICGLGPYLPTAVSLTSLTDGTAIFLFILLFWTSFRGLLRQLLCCSQFAGSDDNLPIHPHFLIIAVALYFDNNIVTYTFAAQGDPVIFQPHLINCASTFHVTNSTISLWFLSISFPCPFSWEGNRYLIVGIRLTPHSKNRTVFPHHFTNNDVCYCLMGMNIG